MRQAQYVGVLLLLLSVDFYNRAMNRILNIVLAVVLLGNIQVARSSTPDSLFEQGNKCYRNGQYAEAVKDYEAVLSQGLESLSLFYNLGNSYYKMKQIPQAILNYERVLLRDPEHKDAKFNLSLANKLVVDRIEDARIPFVERLYVSVLSLFSADVWGVFSVACFVAALLFVLLYFFAPRVGQKKLGFFLGLLCLFLSVAAYGMGSLVSARMKAGDEAIVFAPTVTVKSDPTEMAKKLFVLHEGVKVKLLAKDGNWRKIQLADHAEGWMKLEQLSIINE